MEKTKTLRSSDTESRNDSIENNPSVDHFEKPNNFTEGKNVKNKKLSIILLVLVIFTLGFLIWKFWINGNKSIEPPTTSGVTLTDKDIKNETKSSMISTYQTKIEPENIPGVTGEVSIGFNNAEQIVNADGDATFIIWVAGNKLYLATRDDKGAVTNTQVLAEGNIKLPAITKSGQTVAVAWSQQNQVYAKVSSDGGSSFNGASRLGDGTGPSLASDNGKIVAVWHNGQEGNNPSSIMFASNSGNSWSSSSRIDTSDKAPLWASVAIKGEKIFATWRDNRGGKAYTIWLRRSLDGGKNWQSEQNIETEITGDPDICTSDGQTVWIAEHGKKKIWLMKSTDGGVNFGKGKSIGSGYFAHLSCTDSSVGVAWESTTESAKAKNKKVGWAIYNREDKLVGQAEITDGDTAASTIHIRDKLAEIVWLKVDEDPLSGTLRHSILTLK